MNEEIETDYGPNGKPKWTEIGVTMSKATNAVDKVDYAQAEPILQALATEHNVSVNGATTLIGLRGSNAVARWKSDGIPIYMLWALKGRLAETKAPAGVSRDQIKKILHFLIEHDPDPDLITSFAEMLRGL